MSKETKLKPRWDEGAQAYRLNIPANLSHTGKRRQQYFGTKAEANNEAEKLKARKDNFGVLTASMLSPDQISEASEAFKTIAGLGVSLLTVCKEYATAHALRTVSVTIKELCEAFIGSRDTKPRRAQDLWLTANKLPDGMVADYAPQTVEKAFAGLSVGAVREHYKRARAMFSYAVKKGWMATNPVLRIDIPTTKRDEVVIAAPETLEKLFTNALETGEKELLPFLALTFFGGIRPGHDGEMSKIEWGNINGSIVLRANQTKTNRKREIKVSPNLRAWLDRYAALGGDCTGKVVKLTEDQLAEKRRANWKAAGFEKIPQDIARHSFCSYLLARDGDLTAALLASGHSSPKIFWAHYYQHSNAEDTARFWGIIPPAMAGEDKVIHITKAA
jgi:integrase